MEPHLRQEGERETNTERDRQTDWQTERVAQLRGAGVWCPRAALPGYASVFFDPFFPRQIGRLGQHTDTQTDRQAGITAKKDKKEQRAFS